MELQIWAEIQDILPPLSSSQKRQLRKSIEADGVLVPVLVLPDGRIIDGHHRWEIAGDDVPVRIVKADEEKARALAIALNLARRHLSNEQLKGVHEKLRRDKELRKETALALRKEGQTQEEVAALVGVDRSTVSVWETDTSDVKNHDACDDIPDTRVSVPKTEHETIFERAQTGETQKSIAADYQISQQRVSQIVKMVDARNHVPEAVTEDIPLPQKRYRCIVLDPPWPVKKIERETVPNQGVALDYPTMTVDEIEALPIKDLAQPDGCHVYLWVTQKYLPTGLRLFEQWGVKYQCVMTWVKPTGFTPFSWMYNTEHVLFGRIGSLDLERNGLKLSFDAKPERHSQKPDVFFERVLEASPGPRLEMFARQARDGFDVWGNEVANVATA